MRAKSSIACAVVLRTLLMLCASDTEIGTVTRRAPAARARSQPLKLGTSTTGVKPGMALAYASTSSASTNCGMSLAGTKEQTSIACTPAAASALIQACFAAVGMKLLVFCSPSRGPTSVMITSAAFIGILPAAFARLHCAAAQFG